MTHITIASWRDFEKILKKKLTFGESELIPSDFEYPNMWLLSFTPKFFKKLSENEIQDFFSKLINSRYKELSEKHFKAPVTFYVWFDQQALQLRFNFLQGKNVNLPFTCTTRIVDSIEPIIRNFFTTMKDVLGGELYFEVYYPSEDDDDDAYEIKNYVLDVYTQLLLPNSNYE